MLYFNEFGEYNKIIQAIFLTLLLSYMCYRYFFVNKKIKNKLDVRNNNDIYHQDNLDTTKYILIWFLIIVICIILYAFRYDLKYAKDRILAAIIPNYTSVINTGFDDQDKIMKIIRNHNGHFYINGYSKITDNTVKFMIDTGATSTSITKKDAVKLGINLNDLVFGIKVSTANGYSYSAPATIEHLKIGEYEFYNFPVNVMQNATGLSLIGMSLLNKFIISIDQDFLILQPK